MKSIQKNKVIDLEKIYGIEKVKKWEKSYPIFKIQCVKNWLIDKIDKYTDEGKNANKFSITTYLQPLTLYCKYNKVEDPSELLEEEIDQRNLRLKVYLKEFLLNSEIKEEEFTKLGFRFNKKKQTARPSEESVRNLIQSRIKSFFSNRGKPISFNMKSAKSGANKGEITLNAELIKLIQARLESKNYRLITKCMNQMGFRIDDILSEMTSGKYIIEKYNNHYFIRNFKTQKRMVIINYAFFTKELEDVLIAATGIKDLTQVDLTKLFLTRNGTRINGNDFLDRLKAIIRDLGISGNIKTHSLRKYYLGQIGSCANKLKEPRILTHFEGHEASFNDQVYLRAIKEIESYYEEWLKCEEAIMIDYTTVDKTDKEVLALKEENAKLNKRLDLAINQKAELEEQFKQEIEQVKKELINNTSEDQLLNKFANNLITKISNFNENKTDFKKHIDSNQENFDSNEILMDKLVQTLFEVFKK